MAEKPGECRVTDSKRECYKEPPVTCLSCLEVSRMRIENCLLDLANRRALMTSSGVLSVERWGCKLDWNGLKSEWEVGSGVREMQTVLSKPLFMAGK